MDGHWMSRDTIDRRARQETIDGQARQNGWTSRNEKVRANFAKKSVWVVVEHATAVPIERQLFLSCIESTHFAVEKFEISLSLTSKNINGGGVSYQTIDKNETNTIICKKKEHAPRPASGRHCCLTRKVALFLVKRRNGKLCVEKRSFYHQYPGEQMTPKKIPSGSS
jgi:hypothetical protein